MKSSLFFIGICPSHPISDEIHGIKESFHQKHETKGALRSKAHITLQMPFKFSQNKESTLIQSLEDFFGGMKSFEIQLDGFGKFEPRVIFINVVDNPRLDAIQKSLAHFMKKFQIFGSTHKNNGFHPHITVAFRDLKKTTFYKIWDEVENVQFKKSFRADTITIFKHNGVSWDIYKEISLQ
ncbi:2'-5' RNA ligase family protein [Marivirga sp.]|uniref:2'-5' RNA ligase family protein n=1 Tax=Marivirga sp. TaxID=2018662 RepID=UPI002D7E86C9|nr:2'-5' RNA ligase family protein [Marivirga sp.]HET8859776.1 2'-5' RNA ligase family protein [Marivirga sp.]